jgi:hypothetical protein
VVSPLRRAIQSAIIAFPTHTPFASLNNIPWICNPYLMEKANGNKSEFVSSPKVLQEIFPGVDFTMMNHLVGDDVHAFNAEEPVPLFENKIDLLGRTDDFLRFLKKRDERVIVGKCLDSLIFSLDLMLLVGLNKSYARILRSLKSCNMASLSS